MAYATYTDVASEFKDITFSSTTKVTDSEVTEFISQAEAHINGVVSKRYTVPVVLASAPISFAVLKQISIYMVADRVREILQVKQIGVEELKQGARPPNGRKEALAMLRDIVDGNIRLYDATLATAHDGVKSFNVDEDIEHFFDATIDQW